MKLARAKRLGGELIDAINGSHDDCKLLDMVCDNCGESVIYRQAHSRNYEKGQTNIDAVWVHRSQKSPELQDYCELRVNGESLESISNRRAETRNQRYKFIENSLWEMHYRFNAIHYNSEPSHPNDAKNQLRQAKKFWRNADHLINYLADKTQRNLRRLDDRELSNLITKTYEQDLDPGNGIDKIQQGILLNEFRAKLIPDFHLMLCREIIEYCLKNSQINIFKIIFGTYATIHYNFRHIYMTNEEQLAIMFVRRICMTDWVEAYNWARSHVKLVHGFGK